MKANEYQARASSTYRRLLENGFFLILAIYGNWLVYIGTDTLDTARASERFVLWGLIPIFNFYVFYYAFVRIYEFTRMMTFVQADPEAGLLRMRNLWKKEAIVSAESIRAIEPVRPLPLTSGWKHLALVDDSGYKHIIHHNVEPLGKCMETIRSMCPNLKSVDYGGLDRHGLWTIRGKM